MHHPDLCLTSHMALTQYIQVKVLITQSCLTLCDPMDCSPPGSSVHGIFQARILEWIAIFFSRRSFQPRDRTWVSYIAVRFFTNSPTREDQVFIRCIYLFCPGSKYIVTILGRLLFHRAIATPVLNIPSPTSEQWEREQDGATCKGPKEGVYTTGEEPRNY